MFLEWNGMVKQQEWFVLMVEKQLMTDDLKQTLKLGLKL